MLTTKIIGRNFRPYIYNCFIFTLKHSIFKILYRIFSAVLFLLIIWKHVFCLVHYLSITVSPALSISIANFPDHTMLAMHLWWHHAFRHQNMTLFRTLIDYVLLFLYLRFKFQIFRYFRFFRYSNFWECCFLLYMMIINFLLLDFFSSWFKVSST